MPDRFREIGARFYLMVLSAEDPEYENPAAVLAEHEATSPPSVPATPAAPPERSAPTSRPTPGA